MIFAWANTFYGRITTLFHGMDEMSCEKDLPSPNSSMHLGLIPVRTATTRFFSQRTLLFVSFTEIAMNKEIPTLCIEIAQLL